MESWFCIWNDLFRQLAKARVANPKNVLNLVPNPLQYQEFTSSHQKILIMINDKLDFRFLKVKNGKPFFAIVNLEVSRSDTGNKIVEEYLGEGWKSQGSLESVPMNSYEPWKKAVKNGLEFAFSKSNEKWEVKIKRLEGRIGTDTNPTIVGFATILAFCEQTNLKLDLDLRNEIENFTFKSWENKNDERIPNFINLVYDK